MRYLVALITAFSVAVLSAPRPAEACSPPQDYDLAEGIPSEGLVGVPVAGVVPIYMIVNTDIPLTVVVTDSAEQVVAGSHAMRGQDFAGSWGSITTGRLVWRAASPLMPSTTYTMTISSDDGWNNSGPLSIRFTTRAADLPSSPTFTINSTTLAERIYVSDEVCCGNEIDSCGFGGGSDCFATASRTSHSIYASVAFSADEGRYAEFSVSLDGAPSRPAYSSLESGHVGSSITDLAGAHCLSITMTSLVDGRSHNQTRCVRADAMQVGNAPALYSSDVCSDPDPDPDPLPDSSGGDSGGCTVGGNAGSSSALLLLAALLLVRRRR